MVITETFKSSSSSTIYTASLDEASGLSTCDCPGWRFQRPGQPRGCKHTRQLEAKHGSAQAAAPVMAVPVTDTPVVTEAQVDVVEPMLASAMTSASIADYENGEWVMEPKIDGHRLLVDRRRADVVTCWTRGGNGRKSRERTLPSHLAEQAKRLPVGLYDGELHVPGGMSSDVTRLDRINDLTLALFDVLESEGLPVMDMPYADRRVLLVAMVAVAGGDRIKTLPTMPVSRANVEALWAAGEEGAIIKRLASVYEPGRRSAEWIKVKRAGAAVCTVVGYESGKLGPQSCIVVREDGAERPAFPVKTLNVYELKALGENPEAFIGRKLVVSYIERFPATGVMRHPMWDHWASDEEACGKLATAWAYVAKKRSY